MSQQDDLKSTLKSRTDFDVIASFIRSGSRVLDVGCGDGSLLCLLQSRRSVDGRGVELSQQGVDQCLSKGLSVIQGDADSDLIYTLIQVLIMLSYHRHCKRRATLKSC